MSTQVNMTLSMVPQPTRMELCDNNGVIKLSMAGGKEAELISVTTGRCDQNPQRVTVAVIWEAEVYESLRSKEDMFLIPGIASIKDKDDKKGMDILFLILEVRIVYVNTNQYLKMLCFGIFPNKIYINIDGMFWS